MIGICEAGVLETIDFVLKQFSADDQLLLTKHIFLTGGCSNFKGKTVTGPPIFGRPNSIQMLLVDFYPVQD